MLGSLVGQCSGWRLSRVETQQVKSSMCIASKRGHLEVLDHLQEEFDDCSWVAWEDNLWNDGVG